MQAPNGWRKRKCQIKVKCSSGPFCWRPVLYAAWHQHLMTRPLSNDLRERVVAAVAGGESCRSIASRFAVAVSSVVKVWERHRTTGSVAPGKIGGHRRRVLEPHRAFILDRIVRRRT
jgi:transposase-like protein